MTPGLRLRLTLWYAAAIGSLTLLPWLAVSLTDAGLDGATAAAALLLIPIGQLVAGPAWAWLADRTQAPHQVLRAAAALTTVAALVLAASSSPLAMVLAVLGWSVGRSPLVPLADALTVRLLGDDRRDYGKIRGPGSVIYLLGMLFDGFLRETWPRAPLWLGAGLLALTTVITFTLPPLEAAPRRPTGPQLFRTVLHPRILPLLALCVLHGTTVTAYDSLFSLHVEGLGFRPSLTGAAVALGVAVEFAVMLQGRRLIDHFGPLPLFAVAIASGIPRWILTSLAPDPWVLAAAQGLHGLGFGLFWIAGVALFSERAPPELASSVQSLLPASTFGLGYLLSMAGASLLLRQAPTSTVFAVAAVVSTLATAGAVTVWLRQRREPDAPQATDAPRTADAPQTADEAAATAEEGP